MGINNKTTRRKTSWSEAFWKAMRVIYKDTYETYEAYQTLLWILSKR